MLTIEHCDSIAQHGLKFDTKITVVTIVHLAFYFSCD
jgi:hypothetical protein